MKTLISFLAVAGLAIVAIACSSSGGSSGGSGGGSSPGTGGSSGTGGSATGGSSGTGGASAGGGSASSAGVFPDFTTGTNGYAPVAIVDGAGVIHVAYDGFSGDEVRYGECSANCGGVSGWTFVTVDTHNLLGGDVRLALTSAGHPRLMYHVADLNTALWRYASCDTGCTAAPSAWTTVVAHSLAGDGTHYTAPTHDFELDALDHPHLLYSSYENGANLTTYVTCQQASCLTAANWASVVVDATTQWRPSIATTPTGGVRAAYTDTTSRFLAYQQCDSNCTVATSWSAVQPLYYSYGGEARIRLDAQGRPRIAYYQGVSGSTAAMSTDNQVLFATCDSNCTTAASWQSNTIGLMSQDGENGLDLALDGNGNPVVVYGSFGSPYALRIALCTAGCTGATPSWTLAPLETSDSIAAQVAAPVPASCSGATPMGYWYPGYAPSVQLVGTGALVASETRSLEQCGTGGTVEDGPNLPRVFIFQ